MKLRDLPFVRIALSFQLCVELLQVLVELLHCLDLASQLLNFDVGLAFDLLVAHLFL